MAAEGFRFVSENQAEFPIAPIATFDLQQRPTLGTMPSGIFGLLKRFPVSKRHMINQSHPTRAATVRVRTRWAAGLRRRWAASRGLYLDIQRQPSD
jgi:hypothetical protein